jgi:dihydroflavonol-4-reductase
MELSVINPDFVFGPLMDGTHYDTSAETIRKMLAGEYPGCARVMFAIVDVRDFAAAHLAAITNPDAANQRYLCAVDTLWFQAMSQILHKQFSNQGYKISTRLLPDIFIRIFSLFDKSAREVTDCVGRELKFSNQNIIHELNWKSYSAEGAIVAMGERFFNSVA